jgi:hypothetical protein
MRNTRENEAHETRSHVRPADHPSMAPEHSPESVTCKLANRTRPPQILTTKARQVSRFLIATRKIRNRPNPNKTSDLYFSNRNKNAYFWTPKLPRRARLLSGRFWHNLNPAATRSKILPRANTLSRSARATQNAGLFTSNPPSMSSFLIDSALRLKIAATATQQRSGHVSNR